MSLEAYGLDATSLGLLFAILCLAAWEGYDLWKRDTIRRQR